MKTIIKVLISKRFKSFYWRTVMMVVASFSVFLANNIGDFGLTGQFAVVLGLVLGEISKALNKSIKVE